MAAIDHPWHLRPDHLSLSSREVHVWRAWLDQPAPVLQRLAETLSPDDRARAEVLYFGPYRQHFVSRRGILRDILAGYLGVEPSRLRFSYGVRGKPALAHPVEGRMLHFNLSHAEGLALFAVARGRDVGIDVERIRAIPDLEEMAGHFFSRLERAALARVPPDDRLETFLRGWTRKEAFIKATGDALPRPLDSFDVSLAPGQPAELLRVEGEPFEASRWSLHELAPAGGYVAVLAVEGARARLACWQWTAGVAREASDHEAERPEAGPERRRIDKTGVGQ